MLLAQLPLFACTALAAQYCAIAESRAPDQVIGGEDRPYLRRWHITPRGNGPAVYLHQFLRSDDDRALHDHPWPSVGLILHGAYLEHEPGQDPWMMTAGMLVQREALTAHRVELLRDVPGAPEKPVWTLFITGPRIREWGFHCPQGWVHWRDFTAGEHGETVGRGCD
jgi:hypothetical protein